MSIFIWWFIIFCLLNKKEEEQKQSRNIYRYEHDEEYY
jgi:hypothetical protein